MESSGITSSSSTSNFVPIPVHSGHAPKGELKEKERGSNSSKESSQSWQAICSLYVFSFSGSPALRSTKSKITKPFANRRAVSMESVRRDFESALTVNRSTTTSMVCFSVFLSFGISSMGYTTPSTRTREKPWTVKSLKRSTNSPLRARITGARTRNFIPSVIPRI